MTGAGAGAGGLELELVLELELGLELGHDPEIPGSRTRLIPGSKARSECSREGPKIETYWKWEKKAQGCSRSAPFFHFQYFSISGPSREHPNLLLYCYFIVIILFLSYVVIILFLYSFYILIIFLLYS